MTSIKAFLPLALCLILLNVTLKTVSAAHCTSPYGGGYCEMTPMGDGYACRPSASFTASNPSGKCPDGVSPGSSIPCTAVGFVSKCVNSGKCAGEGDGEPKPPGGEEGDQGKTYVTGSGDGRGITQSSPVTPNCTPTQQKGPWKSEAYATIYEDTSDCWASELKLQSWGCGGVKEWYGHGEADEKKDIIYSDCSGQCPGRGEWKKTNPQISMDCVTGGSTPPGEEGVYPDTGNCDNSKCYHSNLSTKCQKEGYNGCGVKNLEWSSSCQWEQHCVGCSLDCGVTKWQCPEGYVTTDIKNEDNEVIGTETKCPKAETCHSVTTSCWNSQYVKSCGQKFECYREICSVLEEDSSTGGGSASIPSSGSDGGGCEQTTQYEMVFNRGTGCEKTLGPMDLGTEVCDDQLNPAKCQSYEYTAEYKVDDGSGNFQFFEPGPYGQCVVYWSRLDAPDGVNGLAPAYGKAGRNGRWILVGGEGEGWQFDQGSCKFVCNRDDQGADCHSQTLRAKLRFVPDLRLVIYRDNGFIADMAPDSGEGKSHYENCSTGGVGSTENQGLNSQTNAYGETAKFKRSIEYAFDGAKQEIYRKLNSDPPAAPTIERMILGEEIFLSDHSFDLDIVNEFSSVTDEGYWACSCLTTNPNQANIIPGEDCQLTFTPNQPNDICTTKRLYAGFRDCYSTAWWQVSGGNVYAQQDIVDSVPTNLNNDPNCDVSGDYTCEDTDVPAGHQNDYPTLPTESQKVPSDESCTPRIIRGRTPCKVDGPSNSSGIALTQQGQVYAADEYDYYYNHSNLSDQAKTEYLQRVTERSNIHALYQGKYNPTNNINNPDGLQSKIGNSRVLPVIDSLGNSQDNGYKPPVEDWRYFVALAGGIEKLQSISPNLNNASNTNFGNLKNRCAVTETEDTVTYLCYVSGDLKIHSDSPWVVAKANGKFQNYTVFVDGNLTFSGNANDSNAVTTVNIGNFLGFVVSGDITVEPEVGIKMPDPKTVNVGRCWEGQSATLNGVYPSGNQTQADKTNAIGVMEGVFIADGNFTVEHYPSRSESAEFCRTDKRFIVQGIVVAWENIKLLRDFSPRDAACEGDTYGVYNNRVPIETFIYRPDIVRNTPAWMKRSTTTYREITGTAGL